MTRTFCIVVAVVLVVTFFVVSPQYVWAAEAGHQKPSLNPMEFIVSTGLWTLVIFTVFCGILYKYAWGPIAKALDEREQGILNNIAAAQKQNDDAKNLLSEYQAKLDAAREEVRQILDHAKKDAQRQAEDIMAKAREAATLERDRAMREIDGATTAALQSIAERSATLATNLAAKMIRADIKPEQHRNLIDAALREFTTKS